MIRVQKIASELAKAAYLENYVVGVKIQKPQDALDDV
jgi:hypothetical protein